ncbi:MAG: 5-formyltetrahydrofolate cyclo-ligase [Anaeromyxobacter sp.]
MQGGKQAFRAEVVAQRARRTPAERAEASRRIAERAATLPVLTAARTVALYAPLASEVDVLLLLERLTARAVFPRARREGRVMTFACCAPGELVAGPLRVLEPPPDAPEVALEAVEVVVVPGLAFSLDGHRLGRGGGYYDATLCAMPHAVRLGVSYEGEVFPSLPFEPHDAPLDVLVTEARVLHFQRESR